MREQEEPLPGHSSIIQPFLSLKLHPKSCLEVIPILTGHDSTMRILKYVVSTNRNLEYAWEVVLEK